MLAYSDAIARGDASPPPIARLIGFDLISVKPGEAVVEFQATEAHANPMAKGQNIHATAESSFFSSFLGR